VSMAMEVALWRRGGGLDACASAGTGGVLLGVPRGGGEGGVQLGDQGAALGRQ
jgi:hypothetical protein